MNWETWQFRSSPPLSLAWSGDDFIPDEASDHWNRLVRKVTVEFWNYKPIRHRESPIRGDFFGHGSWELGVRNATNLDYVIFFSSLALAPGITSGMPWVYWKAGEYGLKKWLESSGLGGQTSIIDSPSDRKLNFYPRGKALYGNYTGPGNKPSDWKEDQLEPMTPVDEATMRHDQEYQNIEDTYGWEQGDPMPFMAMRFDVQRPLVHSEMMVSDARLILNSYMNVGTGLADGEYDLTFSKGTLGFRNLISDIVVAGVIAELFPILMSWNAASLSVAIPIKGMRTLDDALFQGRVSDGAKYYGGRFAGSAKSSGRTLSSLSKRAGGHLSKQRRNLVNLRLAPANMGAPHQLTADVKQAGARIEKGFRNAGRRLEKGARRIGRRLDPTTW